MHPVLNNLPLEDIATTVEEYLYDTVCWLLDEREFEDDDECNEAHSEAMDAVMHILCTKYKNGNK
jgi:hypothetical protein